MPAPKSKTAFADHCFGLAWLDLDYTIVPPVTGAYNSLQDKKNPLKFTPRLFLQDPPLANTKMCFRRPEHPSKPPAEAGGPKTTSPWTTERKEQLTAPAMDKPSSGKQLPQPRSRPRLCHPRPAKPCLAKLWLHKRDAQCS